MVAHLNVLVALDLVRRDAGIEEAVEPLAIVVVLEHRPAVVPAGGDVVQPAVGVAAGSSWHEGGLLSSPIPAQIDGRDRHRRRALRAEPVKTTRESAPEFRSVPGTETGTLATSRDRRTERRNATAVPASDRRTAADRPPRPLRNARASCRSVKTTRESAPGSRTGAWHRTGTPNGGRRTAAAVTRRTPCSTGTPALEALAERADFRRLPVRVVVAPALAVLEEPVVVHHRVADHVGVLDPVATLQPADETQRGPRPASGGSGSCAPQRGRRCRSPAPSRCRSTRG